MVLLDPLQELTIDSPGPEGNSDLLTNSIEALETIDHQSFEMIEGTNIDHGWETVVGISIQEIEKEWSVDRISILVTIEDEVLEVGHGEVRSQLLNKMKPF